MIIKNREESKQFGIQSVDVESILNELMEWQQQYGEEDPLRFAMINSFEDIILNSIIGE